MKLEDKYTSLELSKKLTENGCKLYTKHSYITFPKVNLINNGWYPEDIKDNIYPAYDILWDICVKYARQFFGEFLVDAGEDSCNSNIYHPIEILLLLQQNKKQEAEDYIWRNTIFNKKNKK